MILAAINCNYSIRWRCTPDIQKHCLHTSWMDGAYAIHLEASLEPDFHRATQTHTQRQNHIILFIVYLSDLLLWKMNKLSLLGLVYFG